MRVISDKTGLTVVTDEGDAFIVSATDVVYPTVKKYLIEDRGQDVDVLRKLLVEDKEIIREITETAVKAVDGEDGDSYRLKHGDPVEDTVFEHAIRAINADQNPGAIVKFLERLERNPSAESRSQLFAWIKAEGLTITPDGMIVAYKGVTTDYHSLSEGVEPVTVTTADGKSKVIVGRIPYPIGATVTIPREMVDTDRNAACSVGLHVGTFGYANSFGPVTILVLVDPADVVSVPRDASDQKVRVSKLFVAREYDADSPIADTVMSFGDDEARSEYAAREDNRIEPRDEDDDEGDEDDGGYSLDDDLDDTVDFEEDYSDYYGDDDDDPVDNSTEDVETVDNPDDTLIQEVMDSVAEKLVEKPHTNRELGKRFSKARRQVLSDALERLVAEGTIELNDSKEYELAP